MQTVLGFLVISLLLGSCERLESSPERVPLLEGAQLHTDLALPIAREDERLADEVEAGLGQRWESIATLLREGPRSILSMQDVLRRRGVPDPEAGLPVGVFSDRAAQRRYFAALLLGWTSELLGLKVAAHVEARRLASLSAARAELPDVDERLLVDELGRMASDRLHALCSRLFALGASCTDTVLEPSLLELGPRAERE